MAATLPRIALRAPRIALALPPRWRLRLVVAALVAAALGAVYMAWLRDSSLVRVERVTVTGLDTPDAPRLQAELSAAARRMTTLHVDESALRQAVRHEPLVRSLSVNASFPHALKIEVVENRPVAMLAAGAKRMPVAPDGTLLPGARTAGAIPTIRLRDLPERGKLGSPSVRRLVALAGAAPTALLARVSSLTHTPNHGLVAQLRRGPAIWFGGQAALALKWQAAAAVLAQRSSRGAAYVDVRMPARPVAGGLATGADAQELPAAAAPGSLPGAPPPIPADPGSAPAGGAAAGAAQPAAAAPAASAPSSAAPGAATAGGAPQTPAGVATTNPGP